MFSCKDEGNFKGSALDYVETRATQDRSLNEVIEMSYPTLVYIFYINFARHKGACKVERDKLLEKGKKFVEIEKGSLAHGGTVLSPIHKEQNPKVKSEREIENGSSPVHKERNPEVMNARVIGRGSRKTRDIEEVAVPGTVKHKETTEVSREGVVRRAQKGKMRKENGVRRMRRANCRR